MKLYLIAGFAALSAGANAQVWFEVGDAVDLPPGQMTGGVGPLLSIVGALGPSDADMYCIEIFAPSVFSATTTNAFTGGLDTQLFLFDMAGMPIAANDDNPLGGTLTSALPIGHPLYAPLPPGDYLIAVSEFDHDPVNAAGAELFPDGPFTAVVGPIAPGPIAGWAGAGGAGGAYEIMLTGATYCAVPEPATFVVLGAALLGLGLFKRRR